jgi:hypothetical protein
MDGMSVDVAADMLISCCSVAFTAMAIKTVQRTNIFAKLRDTDTAPSKRKVTYNILSVMLACCAFTAVSSAEHLLHIFIHFFPESGDLKVMHTCVAVICAVVSVATAFVGYFQLFPALLTMLSKFELCVALSAMMASIPSAGRRFSYFRT